MGDPENKISIIFTEKKEKALGFGQIIDCTITVTCTTYYKEINSQVFVKNLKDVLRVQHEKQVGMVERSSARHSVCNP